MTDGTMVPPTPESANTSIDVTDLADALILLVDDNVQNLELMEAYLESLPCRIQTAVDGVEAFDAINKEAPDMVLLDLRRDSPRDAARHRGQNHHERKKR